MIAELSGFSSYLDLQELDQLPSPPASIRPCRGAPPPERGIGPSPGVLLRDTPCLISRGKAGRCGVWLLLLVATGMM